MTKEEQQRLEEEIKILIPLAEAERLLLQGFIISLKEEAQKTFLENVPMPFLNKEQVGYINSIQYGTDKEKIDASRKINLEARTNIRNWNNYLSHPNTISIFLNALDKEGNQKVYQELLWALVFICEKHLPDLRTRKYFIAALKHKWATIRWLGVRGLEEIYDYPFQIIFPLVDDKSSKVRNAVAQIGRFDYKFPIWMFSTIQERINNYPKDISLFFSLLNDSDEMVQLSFIRKMSELRNTQVLPELKNKLKFEKNQKTYNELKEAIKNIEYHGDSANIVRSLEEIKGSKKWYSMVDDYINITKLILGIDDSGYLSYDDEQHSELVRDICDRFLERENWLIHRPDPVIEFLSAINHEIEIYSNEEYHTLTQVGFLASGLGQLTVDNCGVADISSLLQNIPNCTKLELRNNPIEYFPEEISQLPELRELLFNENKIKGAIPDTIKQLKQLWMLGIKNNQIDNIDAIGNLSMLSYLSIAHNPVSTIEKLPPGIEALTISSSQVNILSKFETENSLRKLFIEGDTNTVSLECLSQFKHLNQLYISSTIPDSLQSIYSLSNLRKLTLQQIGLKEISADFGILTSMKYLDLSNNEIEYVHKDMAKLTELFDLNLNHNKLRTIPDELSKIPRLKTFTLQENDIDLDEQKRLENIFNWISF